MSASPSVRSPGYSISSEVISSVALHGAVDGEEVLALHVRRELADTEFLGERQDTVLRRTNPLAAHLDHGAALECVVQETPADAIASLQDEDRKTGPHHPCPAALYSLQPCLPLEPFLTNAIYTLYMLSLKVRAMNSTSSSPRIKGGERVSTLL
jgi:hypothetical protein